MSCLHWWNGIERSFRSLARCVWAPVIAVVMLCGHAHAGLTIVPTFDSTITSNSNAVAIEGSINAAIGVLEADIKTNVTVTVDFNAINSGLGQSQSTFYNVSYFDYYNALKAVATSPAQLTALASLGPAPTSESSPNPLNGSTQMSITSADGRALGFNTPGGQGPGGTFDSVVSFNLANTSPPNTQNGSFYALQAVAAHELNEVLGTGGAGSNLGATDTAIGSLDLFRYSAPGVRGYTTDPTANAYFSIDGGNTVLSYFNQTAGADYGDWKSDPIPAGFGVQVQDAFGEPGANPALGVNELTALNVAGWGLTSQAVPEPSTVTMLVTAVLVASGFGWSRRNSRVGKTVG